MTSSARGSSLVRARLLATQLVRLGVRIVRDLPLRSPTLWLIVAVNIALVALYGWSRSGQQITVNIEVIGVRYTIGVDGKTVARGEFPEHEQGGVGFRLKSSGAIDSLPAPRGIDSLKITDATTGETLFDDDIRSSADARWKVANGSWAVDDGVLTTNTGGVISVSDPSWGDYYVEAKLRNVQDATLFVWLEDLGSTLQADLGFFRSYRTVVQQWVDDQPISTTSGSTIQLDKQQSIRSITAMMLRPYPVMLLLILVTLLIALAASWVRAPGIDRRLNQAGSLVLSSSEQLMIALCVFAFALLWYILFFVANDMPHVPDSVLYVFQSKIFASGHLYAPAPPTRESFSIFHPHMDQVIDGRWFSHYPFGHPMFLAIGQVIRLPSLIPPLLGASCAALTYLVGRRIFGTAVGLLAAGILVCSPFFEMTASNYMSHNTAAFVILSCLAFYTWRPTRRWLAMLGTGLCFGLLFNIRPLPSVSFMIPLSALMAYDFFRARDDLRSRTAPYVAFAVGALVMFGLYLLYNTATTGSPLESGYAEQGTFSEETFGFDGTHSIAFGLQNQRQLLALMQLVANGWPVYIGFGIAMLPFLFGSRNRWDYFLGAGFLSIAAMNIFYRNAAVMHGPRFWYESLPFLVLLTARGAFLLRDQVVIAAGWIRERISGPPTEPSRAITGTWVLAVIAALMIYSASGWMFQARQAWAGIPFTPAKISELENFNFSDRRLLNVAEDMDLQNALVFVKQCRGWWCFGSEFWTNSPTLDNNVVWAEQQNNSNDTQLLEHYPDRKLYLASYDGKTIVPVTREEIADMATGARPGARPPAR